MEHTEQFSTVGKITVIPFYLGLNISLNMFNKWILSHFGFHFPLYLGICHMIFSFVALAPVMLFPQFKSQHLPTLRKQWLGIVCIGVFFAINIGFNNVSLLSISLSLNQVIRASIPVVTCIASISIEGKKPSREEFLSLFILASGVGVAVYEGSGNRAGMVGILICIVGTICNGLMMSFSGKVMSEKVDVLRLTWYTAPVSCIVMLPFFVMREREELINYSSESGEHIAYIVLTCVNALAYNMIHYLVIKMTSAVTTTVLGEMKIVLLLILSAIMLGEGKEWTPRMTCGTLMAIGGFCLYSHIKLKAMSASTLPTHLPPQEPPGKQPSDEEKVVLLVKDENQQ